MTSDSRELRGLLNSEQLRAFTEMMCEHNPLLSRINVSVAEEGAEIEDTFDVIAKMNVPVDAIKKGMEEVGFEAGLMKTLARRQGTDLEVLLSCGDVSLRPTEQEIEDDVEIDVWRRLLCCADGLPKLLGTKVDANEGVVTRALAELVELDAPESAEWFISPTLHDDLMDAQSLDKDGNIKDVADMPAPDAAPACFERPVHQCPSLPDDLGDKQRGTMAFLMDPSKVTMTVVQGGCVTTFEMAEDSVHAELTLRLKFEVEDEAGVVVVGILLYDLFSELDGEFRA